MPTNTENSFATKLKRLFDEKRKPDGTRYLKKDVLDGIPPDILTRVYLWRLEKGKVLKPKYEVVKALADFFEVQPSYFFEDDEGESKTEPEKIDQREELHVLLRSIGLDANEAQAVLLIVDKLKKERSS